MTNQMSVRSRCIELLVSYHRNRSISARNQLVQMNAGLVRKIAHRVSHQCAEPYEDLEQIGYLGLIRAIERFDPSQGCAFSSFAVPYIRGEMLHFLRDKSSAVKIPRRWQDLQREGQKIKEELTNKLGYTPNESMIAQKLGVSVQEWRQSLMASQNSTLLSLDATVSQQVDTQITLADTLLDTNYQALQRSEEERQQLQSALSQLEENTREVIESVFLNEIPRKEVAKTIGVSPMTVTRRLQKGIDQLATLMTPATA